jgi:hypothetical protein
VSSNRRFCAELPIFVTLRSDRLPGHPDPKVTDAAWLEDMRAGKRDDQRMLIRETREIMVSMLNDAGVTLNMVTALDVRTTVEVLRRFAAIPVDGVAPAEEDGDGVLAQFGTSDFRGQREFWADLTRQFVEAGDEDAPMWQLSCTFRWVSPRRWPFRAGRGRWTGEKRPETSRSHSKRSERVSWAHPDARAPLVTASCHGHAGAFAAERTQPQGNVRQGRHDAQRA